MKFSLFIFFLPGILFAPEGGPYGLSAPPYSEPGIRASQPRPNQVESGNVICLDCRQSNWCCSGDSFGAEPCYSPISIGCCSTLIKQLGEQFFAEPDIDARRKE